MQSSPIEISEEKKIRALPWNVAHSALTSIFFLWTFGGSIFVLFLNELGLPKSQIGTLLSFFPFSGLIALFFAPLATRIGRKKVFLACYGSRYFVIANLLLLPWLIATAGRTVGIVFLFVIMLLVAILRAMGETAYYPWSQEFIPNGIRGRYGGIVTVASLIASGAALLIASIVIERGTGLSGYLWLIGVGTVIGLAGIIVMNWVPGGAPIHVQGAANSHFANMAEALRDSNLSSYLRGMGGIMLGSVLLTSFLPLYVKEQIGLPASTIVIMDTVVMVGGVLSSIFWGWAADRLGSRPVILSALGIGLLLPIGWAVLPRQISNAVIWCGLLYFLYGVVSNGSAIGTGRLLFNSVIPQDKSTAYTAIYYAWMGVTGGIAPLFAGWILSVGSGQQLVLSSWVLDEYTVLFGLSLVLIIYGLWQYSKVRPDSGYGSGRSL